jgi:hypothetical protein
MAEAVVLDRNLDLVGTERAWIVLVRLQFLVRPLNGPGIDFHTCLFGMLEVSGDPDKRSGSGTVAMVVQRLGRCPAEGITSTA